MELPVSNVALISCMSICSDIPILHRQWPEVELFCMICQPKKPHLHEEILQKKNSAYPQVSWLKNVLHKSLTSGTCRINSCQGCHMSQSTSLYLGYYSTMLASKILLSSRTWRKQGGPNFMSTSGCTALKLRSWRSLYSRTRIDHSIDRDVLSKLART